MGRGGYRENAGRKSTWPSGRGIDQTKLIRIPTEFASVLLSIAHKLDSGESIDLDTESKNDNITKSNDSLIVSQVIEIVSNWQAKADEASQKNSHWTKARILLNELRSVLANCCVDYVTESDVKLESVAKPDIDLVIKADNSVTNEIVTELNNYVLETVTDSMYQSASQLELLNSNTSDRLSGVTDSKFKPLSGSELARRLGVDSSQVSRHRNGTRQPNIVEWSRYKDPDGVAWQYSENLKKYIPILAN